MRFYFRAHELMSCKEGERISPDRERPFDYFRVVRKEGRQCLVQGIGGKRIWIGPGETLGFAGGNVWRCVQAERYDNPLRRVYMQFTSRQLPGSFNYWEGEVVLSNDPEYAIPRVLHASLDGHRHLAVHGDEILVLGECRFRSNSSSGYTVVRGGEAVVTYLVDRHGARQPSGVIVRPFAIGMRQDFREGDEFRLVPLTEFTHRGRAELRSALAERLERVLRGDPHFEQLKRVPSSSEISMQS